MVSEGTGTLFKRKDGKYLIYIPKDVAEDSQFPFKVRARPRTDGLGWQYSEKVRVKIELYPEPRIVIVKEHASA
jgi:ribosomal protein L24E